MAKKTPEQIAAQQAKAAMLQYAKNKKQTEQQRKKEVKQFLASNKDLANRMGANRWGGWLPESMDDLKSQFPQFFNTTYEQPNYYTGVKSDTPETQAIADIYAKAYQDWRAANVGNYGALYTTEEQKKYLPKGFTPPDIGWQKAKDLGLDAYDQYGNIIPRSSMVSSWMGDAISQGKYVAPNVMAAATGAPQEEVDRLLKITLANKGMTISPEAFNHSNYPGFNLAPGYKPPGVNYSPTTTTTPGTTTTTGTTPPPSKIPGSPSGVKSPVPKNVQDYLSAMEKGFGLPGQG